MRRGIAVAIAGVVAAAGGASDAQSPVPAARTIERHSLYVSVRDGTRLAVNVYRRAGDPGPVPTIFAFTPYRARYLKDGAVAQTFDQAIFGFPALVQQGYAVVIADVRGKGASFGARRGFLDRTEANDGYDLVGWIARQPWSNGKVGLTGCSYLGGTTMLIAGTRPPAVRAVFTAATDLDKYSFVRNGGVTAQFNTRPDEPLEVDAASVPVDADRDGSLLKQAVAQHARNTPMAALWAGMPYRDSVSPLTGTRFWEEVGPYTHLKALRDPRIAWYFWSNWEDEPTEQMILAARNIPGKLILGPGSHCEGPAQFDIAAEQRRFFDRHLKGIDNGIDREPRYAWWREDGAGGAMVRANRLPGVGIRRTPLFLAADTGASLQAPRVAATRRFQVRYDLGAGEYFPFWPRPLTGFGPSWTTPPLAAPARLQGYPIARIRLAIDRRDAILFAYVEDVAPDGKVRVIAHGRLAASHRMISTPPYDKLDLPYHSGLRADVAPMTPGMPAELAFSLSPRAYTFAAGHRIRVTLTGADPRQRDLKVLATDPAPEFTVLTGGAAGSRIDLPFEATPTFQR
ncbi:CocE/NonD family hydrolase [uncultured Sphingomonas sp.]|uniref:CocE/NonD family hydrolase n=1 Tax=uncultured Sphingomonas sp. TaxID=158754 RepID=UPI0025FD9956|nr:CocE/NonD family hydrolase [uncultured Sphingomonas sp.]